MPTHIFTTGETITADKLNSKPFDVLIVGGGGGGGASGDFWIPGPLYGTRRGSGGGGGGVIETRIIPAVNDSWAITIGGGGAAGTTGVDTTFGPLTANGGTGGASGVPAAAAGGNAGAATSGQGSLGGLGAQGSWSPGTYPATDRWGGGGGGAGGNGGMAHGFGTAPGGGRGGASGQGGMGRPSPVSGTAASYGGGGAGSGASGGVGGGGNTGVAGGINTGGGGGAAPASPVGQPSPGTAIAGALGGSGVVIVAYDGPQKATGGTITSAGGRTVHTFTSGPATFTWTG